MSGPRSGLMLSSLMCVLGSEGDGRVVTVVDMVVDAAVADRGTTVDEDAVAVGGAMESSEESAAEAPVETIVCR